MATKKKAKKKAAKKARVVSPPKRVVSPPAPPVVTSMWSNAKNVKHIGPPKEAPPGALHEVQVFTKENFLKGRRQAARIAYTTDVHRRTIRWWWTNQFSADVSEGTMLRWSSEDHWEDGRNKFWEQVEERLSSKIAEQNVQQFMKDLEGLDKAYAELTRQVLDPAANVIVVGKDKDTGKDIKAVVVPLTFESRGDAFRTLALLDRRRDEKRKSVLGGLPAMGTGGVGGGDDDGVPLPQLSPKAVKAMARAKLLAEREEFSDEPPAPEQEIDEDGD